MEFILKYPTAICAVGFSFPNESNNDIHSNYKDCFEHKNLFFYQLSVLPSTNNQSIHDLRFIISIVNYAQVIFESLKMREMDVNLE